MSLFFEGGPLVWVQLLLGVLALLAVAVTGGMLLVGRPAPPAPAVLLLAALPGVALLAASRGATLAWEARAFASPELSQTMMAAGASIVLVNQLMVGLLLLLPASLAILAGALAGGLRGPRRFGLPAAAAVLALLAAGATTWSAVATYAHTMGLVRAAVYLVLGGLVAVALLGAHDDARPTATRAGALAALCFPLVVGGLEVSTLAWHQVQAFHAVAHASPELKSMMMDTALELAFLGRLPSWVAVGSACLVGLIGALGALREPRQALGVLPGLVGAGLTLVLWAVAGDAAPRVLTHLVEW